MSNCYECGARVRVVTSKQGTSHYVPVAEEELQELRKAAKEYWLSSTSIGLPLANKASRHLLSLLDNDRNA